MAKGSRHRGSFITGLLLGGAAAAAAVIWNSPQAGRKTREQIAEKVEEGLFMLLGASESTLGRVLTPEQPAPLVTEPVVAQPVIGEPAVPVNPASLTR